MVHLCIPKAALFQKNDWMNLCVTKTLQSISLKFQPHSSENGQKFGGVVRFVIFFIYYFLGQVNTNSHQLAPRCGCHCSALLEWAQVSCCAVPCTHACRGSLYPEGPHRVYLCKWEEPICYSLGDVYVPDCHTGERALCPLSAASDSRVQL